MNSQQGGKSKSSKSKSKKGGNQSVRTSTQNEIRQFNALKGGVGKT